MRIARETDKKTAKKHQVTIKVNLLNQFLPLSLKAGGGEKKERGKKWEKVEKRWKKVGKKGTKNKSSMSGEKIWSE